MFEAKKFPNYFIPSTAKTCSAADVGCDEFTNLSDESKEYFTFVRQCIKTGEAEDAVFYTWEGSDTSGYQLKSHRLKTGTLLAGETEPVPAYIVGADPTACDQTIFKAKIGDAKYNPDCREFYNADGKTSYRLLSKTIISTKDCLQYRKTESTQTDCANSGGAWDSNKLHCIYQGYKTDSKTCSSSSSKCRAYSGAASSNMRIVIQDDFESVTANWSGGASSSEAITAGGHSYKVTEKVAVGAAKIGGDTFAASRSIASLVSADSAYTVSFWAKAPAGGDLAVKFSGASKNTVSISGIKGDWRYYEAGLFMTESKIDSAAALWFELSSSVGFYLDNVILKEVSSKLYLIKNSWSTPAACDQTSGGAYLPQAMLGCKEYSDPNKNTFYLKSFSALCRDVAVGCKAYQQTYNSKSEKNELYNVICALGDKKGGDCKFLGQTVCSVGAGRATCRFNIDDVEFAKLSGATIYDYPQGIYKKNYANYENYLIEIMKGKSLATMMVRDESTAEVPADKTVYLVYDKTKTCQSSYLGCSALGQPALYATSTPASASTVYYKNKPDDYSKLLCNTEAEGCESWTSKGGVDYFKSPEKVCEYKESGSSLGSGSSGWFKKGTSDACYKGLLQNGVNGIWRNADTYYDGSVGACSSQYNGCTEFIDPLDTSAANKKGKPYYLVDNTRLQSLESDQTCGGKASLDEGCVLFNKTSDLTLKWDAKASYALAEKQRKLVSPTSYGICNIKWSTSGPVPTGGGSKGGNCLEDSDCKLPAQLQQSGYTYSYSCDKTDSSVKKDSNTILKVTRDRECGEWLTCRSSYSAYDPTTKKSKVVCGDIGLCNKYQSATGGSLTCANFIAKNPDSGKVLTADNYSKRAIGWTGNDYSGYSIGNKYPITDVTFKRDEESGVKKIFVKGGTKNYDLDGS